MAHYDIDQLMPWMVALVASVRDSLVETAENILEGTKTEGEPISYPVHWDSDVQKRAYFVTGGFGAGIPYQRTNGYVSSGTVTAKPYGAQLYKPHPAGAIGGTHNGWQSSIHVGRWTYLWDVVEREVAKLPELIRKNMQIKEGELGAKG